MHQEHHKATSLQVHLSTVDHYYFISTAIWKHSYFNPRSLKAEVGETNDHQFYEAINLCYLSPPVLGSFILATENKTNAVEKHVSFSNSTKYWNPGYRWVDRGGGGLKHKKQSKCWLPCPQIGHNGRHLQSSTQETLNLRLAWVT